MVAMSYWLCLQFCKISCVGKSNLPAAELARFRRERLGFVFQDFNLLDTLTIEENIGLALTLGHGDAGAVQGRVREVAGRLGIGDILGKFPYGAAGGSDVLLALLTVL